MCSLSLRIDRRGWLRALEQPYLGASQLVRDGVLRGDYLRTLNGMDRSRHGVEARLWALVVLEIWYRIFMHRDAATLAAVEASRPVGVSPTMARTQDHNL